MNEKEMNALLDNFSTEEIERIVEIKEDLDVITEVTEKLSKKGVTIVSVMGKLHDKADNGHHLSPFAAAVVGESTQVCTMMSQFASSISEDACAAIVLGIFEAKPELRDKINASVKLSEILQNLKKMMSDDDDLCNFVK